MGLNRDFIRTRREKLKLTQQGAAKLAGLQSRQVWNDIENGPRENITIETLEKIARALGVKAKDLLE
ncbi:MAG TPA: helix-turn-helix transcriptional regulator [Tepidisphaeraceae bacterium]|jgi:transcriptional regulator with XRE-family HTH domain